MPQNRLAMLQHPSKAVSAATDAAEKNKDTTQMTNKQKMINKEKNSFRNVDHAEFVKAYITWLIDHLHPFTVSQCDAKVVTVIAPKGSFKAFADHFAESLADMIQVTGTPKLY
jgi:hypothetical protein